MAESYSSKVQKVRDHLKEIVGDEYKHVFSDDFIKCELSKFNGRVDAVECALEDLIEIHYAEANEQMNKLIPEDIFSTQTPKPKICEPVTFFHLPFVKKLGRAAKDITSTLETGLQNVAENLEGAFVNLGEGTAERAGCVTRTSSYSSDRDSGPLRHSPADPSSPTTDSVSGGFEGSERERLFESGSQSGAGSMGCGSSYDYRSPDTHQTAPPAPSNAMNCDMCGNKFTFISRKRTCVECGNVFCTTCLPNERHVSSKSRTCSRCSVLNKRPPHRGELMKLRVKDLQHFLTRKRINIKSCVEKKDLVELVLQHSQASSPIDSSGVSTDNVSSPTSSSRLPSSGSWNDNSIRVSDQVPLERSRNFPQNYTESSHRREWFQEKFGDGEEGDKEGESTEEVTETLVEKMEVAEEVTPVEPITDNNNDSEDEVMSVVIDQDENKENAAKDEENTDNAKDIDKDVLENPNPNAEEEIVVETLDEEVQGAVGGAAINDAEEKPSSDPKQIGAKRSFDHLSDNICGGGSSLPSSPRRFANHGLVYLSEIETLEDLNELSTKQIKDLLAMNRVNFKGCVEKEELLKILQRLWKQDKRNKENIETMDDDSLCKICMDSPIDCVMLECGHMCTCTNCGKQMAECPICRQYVVRVVKTFKA